MNETNIEVIEDAWTKQEMLDCVEASEYADFQQSVDINAELDYMRRQLGALLD